MTEVGREGGSTSSHINHAEVDESFELAGSQSSTTLANKYYSQRSGSSPREVEELLGASRFASSDGERFESNHSGVATGELDGVALTIEERDLLQSFNRLLVQVPLELGGVEGGVGPSSTAGSGAGGGVSPAGGGPRPGASNTRDSLPPLPWTRKLTPGETETSRSSYGDRDDLMGFLGPSFIGEVGEGGNRSSCESGAGEQSHEQGGGSPTAICGEAVEQGQEARKAGVADEIFFEDDLEIQEQAGLPRCGRGGRSEAPAEGSEGPRLLPRISHPGAGAVAASAPPYLSQEEGARLPSQLGAAELFQQTADMFQTQTADLRYPPCPDAFGSNAAVAGPQYPPGGYPYWDRYLCRRAGPA
eukprot:g13861.t1